MGDSVLHISVIVFFVIISLALNYIRAYLQEEAKNKKSTTLQRYMLIAESIIETTVIEMNQTVVKAYKTANADGKLTPSEAKDVLNSAFRRVKQVLGTQVLEVIREHMGDTDVWILQEIEKYVVINKNSVLNNLSSKID